MTLRRSWPWLLLLAVTAALSVRALHKRHGSIQRNRFFARSLLLRHEPYAPWHADGRPLHAPYPPSYGMVMAPLLLVPLPVARVLWVLLQMLVLTLVLQRLHAWWCALSATRGPPPTWVFGLALLLVSRYLLRDTAGGGNNLVFGGLAFLACCRPDEAPSEDRRPWLGALLGLVLAAKPTPLLLLLWLLLRGRRRTVLVAVSTGLCLHLSPILPLGLEGWQAAYGRWIHGVVLYATQPDLFATPALGFPPFTWMNQSLRCMVVRYLGTVPEAHALSGPLWFGGLGLDPTAVLWLRRLANLGVLTLCLGRLRKLRGVHAEAAGPALCFAATLLLSPISWKAHHVQLLPAFFVALSALAICPGGVERRKSRLLMLFLAAYFVTCTLLSQEMLRLLLGSEDLGKQAKNILQSLYVVTLGCLGLLVLLPAALNPACAAAGPAAPAHGIGPVRR